MSAPAYKVNMRRGNSMGWANSSNTLYDASIQTIDRPAKPLVDRDERSNLSTWGWRQMLSAAMHIEANFPPISGAIEQMSRYAVGQAFNVQMTGRNKAWNDKAEAALYEHDKICNVKGPNFNMRETLVLSLKTMILCGDANLLLTGTNPGADDDYPQIQNIPPHRIGSRGYQSAMVDSGPYKGLTICNGVIQSDVGRDIAYRVFDESYLSNEYRDISAEDLHLFYRPQSYESGRGITWLRAGINDAADIKQVNDWLKLVIKHESSISLIEKNETGTPSNFAVRGLTPPADLTNPASAQNPYYEQLVGGTYRILKNGNSLESLESTRPSTQVMEFKREILRGCFEGLGWPIEFYDPEKVGGAPARQRIAQAILRLEMLQMIAERIAFTEKKYTIAKFIKLGILEPDIDWWRMSFQRPKSLTVDNGWDIKADLELYKIGAITLQELCARQGNYWEEIQAQKVLEEKSWQEKCFEAEVEPADVRILYPNPPSVPVEEEAAPAKEDKAGPEPKE